MKSEETSRLIYKMKSEANLLYDESAQCREIKNLMQVAARVIEEMADDGWNDAFTKKPLRDADYLCFVTKAGSNGGYQTRQTVLEYASGWRCLDTIVLCWRTLPPEPIGKLSFLKP